MAVAGGQVGGRVPAHIPQPRIRPAAQQQARGGQVAVPARLRGAGRSTGSGSGWLRARGGGVCERRRSRCSRRGASRRQQPCWGGRRELRLAPRAGRSSPLHPHTPRPRPAAPAAGSARGRPRLRPATGGAATAAWQRRRRRRRCRCCRPCCGCGCGCAFLPSFDASCGALVLFYRACASCRCPSARVCVLPAPGSAGPVVRKISIDLNRGRSAAAGREVVQTPPSSLHWRRSGRGVAPCCGRSEQPPHSVHPSDTSQALIYSYQGTKQRSGSLWPPNTRSPRPQSSPGSRTPQPSAAGEECQFRDRARDAWLAAAPPPSTAVPPQNPLRPPACLQRAGSGAALMSRAHQPIPGAPPVRDPSALQVGGPRAAYLRCSSRPPPCAAHAPTPLPPTPPSHPRAFRTPPLSRRTASRPSSSCVRSTRTPSRCSARSAAPARRPATSTSGRAGGRAGGQAGGRMGGWVGGWPCATARVNPNRQRASRGARPRCWQQQATPLCARRAPAPGGARMHHSGSLARTRPRPGSIHPSNPPIHPSTHPSMRSLTVPELKKPGGEVVLPECSFQVGVGQLHGRSGRQGCREARQRRRRRRRHQQRRPACGCTKPCRPPLTPQAVGRGRIDAEQQCARQALERAQKAGLKVV